MLVKYFYPVICRDCFPFGLLYFSIGNLLRHWRVHCQWPSDTHGIEPDGDELLDSLVEANDIILEGVVSVRFKF